jgi:hypothetical protein
VPVNLLSAKSTPIFFICYLWFILIYFNGPSLSIRPFILSFRISIRWLSLRILVIVKIYLILVQRHLIKNSPFIFSNFISFIGFLNLFFDQSLFKRYLSYPKDHLVVCLNHLKMLKEWSLSQHNLQIISLCLHAS